jgi:hypothetical protein
MLVVLCGLDCGPERATAFTAFVSDAAYGQLSTR